MQTDLAQWDRNFRWGLLIGALVFGALDYWLGSNNIWARAGFVIMVAGLVGYFTNFLAIKMLFQPKQGQVLGWQGLVPKNKEQIAKSLGESVQEQLLSPDIILEYIRDRNLIERSTESLEAWIDQALHDEDVRRRITVTLVDMANQRGPDFILTSFDNLETRLKDIARDPDAIALWWGEIRDALNVFLQTDDNRQWLGEKAQLLLSQQLPRIATWINTALDDYLRQKSRLGGIGLGLKSAFSIDQATIYQLLERFTKDPEVASELVGMLDALVDAIQQELASEETQSVIQEQLASWIEQVSGKARASLLPAAIERLGVYLNDPENWDQIESILIKTLQTMKTRAMNLINSDSGRAWLRSTIEKAVHKLNVTELVEEQVMGLDTDELEKMVLDNTGGNLTVIQILGGGLGIIAGTVQVHIAFALPLAALVGVVWVAYRWNEYRCRTAQ